MELGDAALRPFWAKAEALGAVVYIHPGGNRDRRFKRFHLWNSVGQAFEEAMAISSLMYDGVLEHFPKLKICISHGGGYMPFYMGRIDRNYVEKANTRVNMSKPPIEYLRMLYFDSCVYERPVLQHLVDKVGADRVLLGSDYPVGETKPIEFVTETETLSGAQKEQIVRRTRRRWLGPSQIDDRLKHGWTMMDERLLNPISTARARAPLGGGAQGHGRAQDRCAAHAEQQRLARRLRPLVHRYAAEQRLSAQRDLPGRPT